MNFKKVNIKCVGAWMSLQSMRGYSSASSQSSTRAQTPGTHVPNKYETPPQILSKNISYRPALDSEMEPNSRPIVLIYGWLVAKAQHIYKYGDFYLGKGYDVIHVKVLPEQLLRPKKAQSVVEDVLEYIKTSHPSKPILYHGFSVGAYLFGETLVKIHSDPHSRFEDIGRRLCGQVIDSPVDFDNIPFGFSQAVTQNNLLQKALENSLNAYLKAFYKSITSHYVRSSDTFKENKLKLPSLFLYSEEDKVACPKAIEKTIQGYKAAGGDVYSKVFDGTPHVSHFHHHPVQYVNALNYFLEQLQLPQNELAERRQEKIM